MSAGLGLAWGRLLLVAAAGTWLSACGGGGGAANGAAGGATAPAATQSTALASFTPPGAVPANFRALATVPPDLLQALAARLPAATGPRYLRIWAASPGDGTPEVLYLGRWTTGQTVPPVQAQAAMTVLHVELYDAADGVQTEWVL